MDVPSPGTPRQYPRSCHIYGTADGIPIFQMGMVVCLQHIGTVLDLHAFQSTASSL
ncbi:hypothetical protein CGCSCA1_v000878 [Colletotrichum siamense]|nr:hypothetical protein CGCSCA1_v000878 [Colletotrichum siamense]